MNQVYAVCSDVLADAKEQDSHCLCATCTVLDEVGPSTCGSILFLPLDLFSLPCE